MLQFANKQDNLKQGYILNSENFQIFFGLTPLQLWCDPLRQNEDAHPQQILKCLS